ncbi:cell division protein ZapB [Halolamina salina]
MTEWDSEPFTDGHAGLRELAEREFTGAVTDGVAWLFMLNGRVLGVFDGDMDRFADADGTAYVAPDRSLPLLFAMQETGGEVRGEYYTEETPISEVDDTLQAGGFTGYVELSENVLSGDYYLVYYGGRRLPVAFIGNQRRRISGDEAFERADDEVGIYRVRTVDLDIVDVPEPDTFSDAAAGAAASTDDSVADDEPASSDGSAANGGRTAAPAADTGNATEPADTADAGEAAEVEDEGGVDDADGGDDTDGTADQSRPAAAGADDESSVSRTPRERSSSEGTADSASEDAEPAASARTDRSAGEAAEAAMAGGEESTAEESTEGSEAGSSGERSSAGASSEARERFEAESEWREGATIPALDPENSVSRESDDGGTPATATTDTQSRATTNSQPRTTASTEEIEALREERDRLREQVEELEAETERLESENERLSGERDRIERERDEAAATAEELEAELEELRTTVDRLETELDAAESELEAAREYVPDGDHEITPEEAMAGTNLFVRYERKGGPTLEDAHSGDAGREAVNDNIRLEHHTEFDDDGAVVDGRPFEEWLHDTIEYGFVEWLIRTFVHDVRETRNQTSMGTLYDAIPDIDRIELRGGVTLGEEAEEESVSFDVVLRDRMGQPLVVTDLNDSREPATEPMLESLIRNATPVAESNEKLSAAFFVTSSYYEPGALETAEEATGGGLLKRSKNKSFVKLSRKEGYHLCLVETREGEFHVSVPEL